MSQTLAAPEASCDPHTFYASQCRGVTPARNQAPRSHTLAPPPAGSERRSGE